MNTKLRSKARGAIGPATRFALVKAFMQDKGVRQYMPVFAVHDHVLNEHADTIRQWWNGVQPTITDLKIIERMERVVQIIQKNAA
jgi:hypothetical protein